MSTDKTPSELIDHIGELIREREGKNLPTFYSISIEQYDKNTPVAERESGYDNFKKQVLKYMSDYNLTSITVYLFGGKSRKVKQPFQTFKVPIKKTNPTIMLSGFPNEKETAQVEQMESAIPVGRYYDEKFELQMRIMRNEMEKQSLLERVQHLTEKYEDRIKDIEARNHEKVQDLEQDLKDYQNEIDELQRELARNEKEKHNSVGNLALGSITSHAIEKFAVSDIGMALLKGFLSPDGFAQLKGHLNGLGNAEQQTPTPETEKKETARIIVNPATSNTQTSRDPRQVALAFIQKVGERLSDVHLRMIYDIAELAEKNIKDLEVIYSIAKQIQIQRKAQNETAPVKQDPPKKSAGAQDEGNQDQDNDESENDGGEDEPNNNDQQD